MAQARESGDALEAARRLLAARDADLADADRVLAATVAEVHGIAVDAIGRIEEIRSAIETVVSDGTTGSPAGAREVGRDLVAKNRELTGVVTEARDAALAKTLALKQLAERYTQR